MRFSAGDIIYNYHHYVETDKLVVVKITSTVHTGTYEVYNYKFISHFNKESINHPGSWDIRSVDLEWDFYIPPYNQLWNNLNG